MLLQHLQQLLLQVLLLLPLLCLCHLLVRGVTRSFAEMTPRAYDQGRFPSINLDSCPSAASGRLAAYCMNKHHPATGGATHALLAAAARPIYSNLSVLLERSHSWS
jgi:hypothetical protein